MEIGFIHPSWPGDDGTGATHTATQMVRGLSDRSNNVTVYCMGDPPSDIGENFTTKNLELSGPPYHPDLQLVQSLKKRTKEFNSFDIVNCYHPSGIKAMDYIGRRTSAKVGVTLNAYRAICPKNDLLYKDVKQCHQHSPWRCMSCCASSIWDNREYNDIKSAVNRIGLLATVRFDGQGVDNIDFFRAPSDHVKKHHVEFGFPETKIHTIPHPINPEFFVRHKSDFDKPYKLLYVGSLRKRKGVDLLIPMLASVRGKLEEDVTLTIVGNGGQENQLRSQVTEYGLTDCVKFAGFVPNTELPTVYATHDLFIHPSMWEEPFARVYLEAMAAGTPILTREYGSIAKMLGDCGIVYDGTLSDLVDSVVDLIANARLQDLSDATLNQSKRYMIDTVVDNIELMYRSKINNI